MTRNFQSVTDRKVSKERKLKKTARTHKVEKDLKSLKGNEVEKCNLVLKGLLLK